MPVPTTDAVTVRVPAKVNVHLAVGPVRSDGFHDLATVFQSVSLYDDVTVSAAPELAVDITGEAAAQVPADTTNLAARAVSSLAVLTGRAPGVRISIHKGIPVAGGMAGGSADAAAALIAADVLWGTNVGAELLHKIAAEIGSDVPFCLAGGTALGAGRGEQLTTVLARGLYHWVFGVADGGLSTPSVYAELDRLRDGANVPPPAVPAQLLAALRTGDPRTVAPLLSNDLQDAAIALRPSLRRTLDAGLDAGALAGIVCGSGPTCAFLVADEPAAIALVATLAGSGTCRSVRRAHGPVPGARPIG